MNRKGKHTEWILEDGLTRIQSWARDGLTEAQIAKNIGVSYTTLKNWKKKYLPIVAALKKGKEPIDFEVENALLRRALGYEYEETTIVSETNLVGQKITKTTTYKKIMQPDTTAAIFWLKNRKPDTWRKLSPEITAKNEKELEKLTMETKMLEYEVEKFEQSGQVNTLLESLVNATKSKDGELDD